MMKYWITPVLLLLSSGAIAENNVAPETVVLCAGCHGEQGISISDEIPNLAGQKKQYLIKAIKDYRSNHRNNPTMNAMAASLTDADIEQVASYFSQLKRP
ncbi:MAG: cytochrome c [Gammaproteobacteria bacterium]|nr:cytochrome c [Gammaproteobacteria bacterium]